MIWWPSSYAAFPPCYDGADSKNTTEKKKPKNYQVSKIHVSQRDNAETIETFRSGIHLHKMLQMDRYFSNLYDDLKWKSDVYWSRKIRLGDLFLRYYSSLSSIQWVVLYDGCLKPFQILFPFFYVHIIKLNKHRKCTLPNVLVLKNLFLSFYCTTLLLIN